MSSSGGPRRNPMGRQSSISSLEQSLNMVSGPPAIAPVMIYPGPGAKHANLAKADLEIVQRLQQLRQSGGNVPSESEMEQRLAKLRDLPTDYYAKKPSASVLLNTDRRTDQQKTDDLLGQIAGEISLDSKLPNEDEDLAARLAQLRCGKDLSVNPKTSATVPPIDSPGLPDDNDITELLKEMGQSCKKKDKKKESSVRKKKTDRKKHAGGSSASHHRRSTSSTEEDEKYSNSSDEDEGAKKKRVKKFSKSLEKSNDNEDLDDVDPVEVERIVSYYTKKVQKKKKGKKSRTKGVAVSYDTDSSSELSESGDATSDSEKLSRDSS